MRISRPSSLGKGGGGSGTTGPRKRTDRDERECPSLFPEVFRRKGSRTSRPFPSLLGHTLGTRAFRTGRTDPKEGPLAKGLVADRNEGVRAGSETLPPRTDTGVLLPSRSVRSDRGTVPGRGSVDPWTWSRRFSDPGLRESRDGGSIGVVGITGVRSPGRHFPSPKKVGGWVGR